MGQPRKETQYIRPAKWGEYQGYKKRGPTWIKNHVKLLDNPKYLNLGFTDRAILHGLWLLFARRGNPIATDTRHIGNALGTSTRHIRDALKRLISNGFMELVDETVALSEKTVAQRQSTETEKNVGAEAPNGTIVDLDAVYYRDGKSVLGAKAGGVLTKLRTQFGTEEAHRLIKMAGGKENPMEYVQGTIKARKGKPTGWAI